MAGNRDVAFTPTEMTRLREAARALGTSYAEFVHFAVMQAVGEVESYGNEENPTPD